VIYLAEGQRLGHMGSWALGPAGFDYWSPELFRMHGLDPARNAPTVQEYLDLIHPRIAVHGEPDQGVLAKASPSMPQSASCGPAVRSVHSLRRRTRRRKP